MCTADDTMCVQCGNTIVVLCGREKLVYLYSQHARERSSAVRLTSFVGEGLFGQRRFPQSHVLSPYLPRNFVWS